MLGGVQPGWGPARDNQRSVRRVGVFTVAGRDVLVTLDEQPVGDGRSTDAVAFSPDGVLLASTSADNKTVSVFSRLR